MSEKEYKEQFHTFSVIGRVVHVQRAFASQKEITSAINLVDCWKEKEKHFVQSSLARQIHVATKLFWIFSIMGRETESVHSSYTGCAKLVLK